MTRGNDSTISWIFQFPRNSDYVFFWRDPNIFCQK